MDSIKSFLPSSSSESSQPEEYDNILTYLLSFIALIFTFVYDNFAYIFGIVVVMFGILVYIKMKKIDLNSQLMSKSQTVIIEGMEGMTHGNNDKNGINDNSDNSDAGPGTSIIKTAPTSILTGAGTGTATASPYLANDLITPPITTDLETKLKSGFCKMHSSKNSPMTDLDSECGAFEKSSCLNTDCCGWAITSDNDNPEGKCRAGDKSGITFKYDDAGKKIKKIDIDCYYYKGNVGIGSKCVP
jgi:hypothetical protein